MSIVFVTLNCWHGERGLICNEMKVKQCSPALCQNPDSKMVGTRQCLHIGLTRLHPDAVIKDDSKIEAAYIDQYSCKEASYV
jgi:hypothetical protein